MENHCLISKTVVLIMVYHALSTDVMTTIIRTPTKDEHTSSATTNAYVRHNEPWQSHRARNTQTPTQSHNVSTLVDSGKSKLFSLSSLQDRGTHCQPLNQTLTDRTGVIAVIRIPEDCIEKRVWTIHLPSPEDGVALWFNSISLKDDNTLGIFSFEDDGRLSRERFVGFYDGHDVHPLLLKKHRFQIVFKTPHSSRHYVSAFNLTYTAYPVHKMPRTIYGSNAATEFYNCSGDVIIPSVFRCNTVKECAHNEDEDDCDYTHEGCGPMVRHLDLCFKVHFVRPGYIPSSARHKTISTAAEHFCSTLYGAGLAMFKDSDSRNLVAHIMRQVGLRSAVIGLKRVRPVSKRMRHLHRYLWQFGGKGSPIAYTEAGVYNGPYDRGECTEILVSQFESFIHPLLCGKDPIYLRGYVCMKPHPSHSDVNVDAPLSVHLPRPTHQITQFPTKTCNDGSLVQMFHLCYQEMITNVFARSSYNFSLYPCRFGPPVHYTEICDGIKDCHDGSDEADCGTALYPPLMDSMFRCRSFQLIPKSLRCDGRYDCFDESDEENCKRCKDMILCSGKCFPHYYNYYLNECPDTALNPYKHNNCTNHCLVTMDGFGLAFLQPANNSNIEGTFWCKDEDRYIPSFLAINGEEDCLSGEDENILFENFSCPGFYRCQHIRSCVHPVHVCDGIIHCPFKDDERYCDIDCPSECLCEGYAFSCAHLSNISALLLSRYLDLNGFINISLNNIHYLELLRFLNLSSCGLNTVYFKSMAQLQVLDLSFNELKSMSSLRFEALQNLTYLNLSNNPFVQVLDTSFSAFIRLSHLQRLKSLVIKNTNLHSVKNSVFSSFAQLEILDMRGNLLYSYESDIFWGLNNLQQLYTDDYKLCCPHFHNSGILDCVAPLNELSSCNDLLRLDIFRVFLWLATLFAISGNASVMMYRLCGTRKHTFSTFGMLVINLCVADLCMGIYIMMIGVADAQFHKVYVIKENAWRRSTMCKVAGFLGFVSSETSALTICLITLDRVLVLCFPLKSHLHMTARSSVAACGIVWFVAISLAVVPLLADLEYYGVNGMCLPLPITRRKYSGQFYSFGVFIVFNFVLFVLIGLGQILIFHAIHSASRAADTNRRSKEIAIARRLFLVILSDFCCWFPVGLMGLLVSCGMPISDEVNVWTAIFVLPLNSALNPFLYTLNSCLDKWIGQKLERVTSDILLNIQELLPRMLPSAAEELVRMCIRSNLVKKENILQILQSQQDIGSF